MMANNYFKQHTVGGSSHICKRSTKQGRKTLPAELKSVRINITLTPQAHKLGIEKAHACGKTFSAWIEEQIYTH